MKTCPAKVTWERRGALGLKKLKGWQMSEDKRYYFYGGRPPVSKWAVSRRYTTPRGFLNLVPFCLHFYPLVLLLNERGSPFCFSYFSLMKKQGLRALTVNYQEGILIKFFIVAPLLPWETSTPLIPPEWFNSQRLNCRCGSIFYFES